MQLLDIISKGGGDKVIFIRKERILSSLNGKSTFYYHSKLRLICSCIGLQLSHTVNTPSATSDTARGELFSGSLGLLNCYGPSYNAADTEVNQEMAEMLRRKKKRRRGMRL